jgi:MFS family permease
MFHGWRIVALAFLTNYISVGFVFYSYGVFFKALAADFSGSRLGVSVGLTSMSLVSALSAPIVGRYLDRGMTRGLMTTGAVLMSLAFVLASQITSLWQFFLVLGFVMGPAVCMLGGLAGATLVATWFVNKRGVALGIATMGVSISGVLMPPIGTALIAELGWRNTFLVYAAVAFFVIAPLTWRFVVATPEQIGQLPDGEVPTADTLAAAGREERMPSTREILTDGRFWMITIPIALNFFALSAVLTHTVPYVTDLGISPAGAALVLSASAGAGSIGKPLFGMLTDRMDKRLTLALCAGLQLIGLLMMIYVPGYAFLLIASGIFGIGMGGVVPLQAALVGAAFGRKAFGRVMGLMSPAMLPIQMLGVPFAGYVFDRTGSYRIAFQVFAGAFALSLALLSRLQLPEHEPGRIMPPAPADPVVPVA